MLLPGLAGRQERVLGTGVGLGQPEEGARIMSCLNTGGQFYSSGESLWDPSSGFDIYLLAFV